jgi:hypothetical protein
MKYTPFFIWTFFSAFSLPAAQPGVASPVLTVTQAVYRADQNVLEFAFQVDNPTDSVIYVDCQGQPEATRRGPSLLLAFAAPDAAAADSLRPQRVGARQGFQGHRRIFGLGPDHLGQPARPSDPLKAAKLTVEMAVYPERLEGEGPTWVLERGARAGATPVTLGKKGTRPKAPEPGKVFTPAP